MTDKYPKAWAPILTKSRGIVVIMRLVPGTQVASPFFDYGIGNDQMLECGLSGVRIFSDLRKGKVSLSLRSLMIIARHGIQSDVPNLHPLRRRCQRHSETCLALLRFQGMLYSGNQVRQYEPSLAATAHARCSRSLLSGTVTRPAWCYGPRHDLYSVHKPPRRPSYDLETAGTQVLN